MNKIAIYIKITSAIVLLMLFMNSSAQPTDFSLPKKEFRINFETVMYRKLIETSNSGHNSFNSRNAPSGILSISDYFRLKHNFAIEPSFGFTIIPYNYNYNIELNKDHLLYSENQKVLSDNIYDYTLPSLRIGLFLTKDFILKDKSNLFAGLGINLNTFPTYLFESGHSYFINGSAQDSIIRFFDLELYDEDYTTAYWSNLSYSLKFGFSKRNNKGNGYNISMIWNFQPNVIGVGDYYFNQGTYKETGTVKWKNSYLGFCFSKTFNMDREKNEPLTKNCSNKQVKSL